MGKNGALSQESQRLMEIYIIIFILLTLCIFMVPMAPALIEYKYPTDAEPLKVVQEYDNNIRHFALGFRQYVWDNFPDFFSRDDAAQSVVPSDKNRHARQLITEDGVVTFDSHELESGNADKLILSRGAVSLPSGMKFNTEIYSAQSIVGGERCRFRAMLAEHDIVIGESSTVLRWIHSGGSLYVRNNCRLFGRAYADGNMLLSRDCTFERLHAARIEFGPQESAPVWQSLRKSPEEPLPLVTDLYRTKSHFGGFWRVNGDVDIPDQRIFKGHVIAKGNVTIGKGSRVEGSIKSNDDIYLMEDSSVEGAVIGTNDIHIAAGCKVLGPVIAENRVIIERGAVIGKEAFPTTINANIILIHEGVTAFGTVWARQHGGVEANEA